MEPDATGDYVRHSDYADLERQIAELRAELINRVNYWSELYSKEYHRAEAAEAEIARLKALPLKDEVERVLVRARKKMHTYVSVYPGDKELRQLLADWDALLSRLRAGEREGCE